ncbi:MAG: FadR/GntR family transcriptional regulator [Eubacteriales bacterium]|jgi:GntR family transcriptional repressor for pyruvate dehydrogenase complex
MDYPISPIPKTKVSDQVLQQLRSNILQGVWPAGTRLPSENKLCQLFGVSRVSVRTALNKLNALGLTHTVNGGGTYVNELQVSDLVGNMMRCLAADGQDFIEMLELRQIIESYTCRRAIEYCTPQDLQQLENLLQAMEKSAGDGQMEVYTRQDVQFHKQLVQMSRHRLLITLSDILFEWIYPQMLTMNTTMGVQIGMEGHQAVLEAIWQKDGNRCAQLLSDSFQTSIDVIRSQYSPTSTERSLP